MRALCLAKEEGTSIVVTQKCLQSERNAPLNVCLQCCKTHTFCYECSSSKHVEVAATYIWGQRLRRMDYIGQHGLLSLT